ncbi:MAG: hypothetical protein RLZZ136_635 [Pseudomonadota bacterium]|jgi:AcrR family transcriptional regulator
MSTRRRLSPEESRAEALVVARALLIESGPLAVTLKAVSARLGRSHANLLYHFGSAAGLQSALAKDMSITICAAIAQAVIASVFKTQPPRALVDLVFDIFGKQGGGPLASWLLLSGVDDPLEPIVGPIAAMADGWCSFDPGSIRNIILIMVTMALGDSLIGAPLSQRLSLPRDSARDAAEAIWIDWLKREMWRDEAA